MLNQKKAPRLDLIMARMLQELPKEELFNLLYIFSATLRLEYWRKSIKTWSRKTGTQNINLDYDRLTPQCNNVTA